MRIVSIRMMSAGLALACLPVVSISRAQVAPPAPTQAPAVVALPSPEPIVPATLDNVLPTKPIRRTANGYLDPGRRGMMKGNERWVDTSLLPTDKAPQLDYASKTADFTVGKVVTGETSKTVALIIAKDDSGTSGSLTLSKVKGDFLPGEPISDDSGGTAIVSGRLKEGVWVLDFAFKSLRLQTIEVPSKGRRPVIYLYYQVVNRTGKPRLFLPQFTIVVPETGKRYEDNVISSAVPVIQAREDQSTKLLGAVDIAGMIPVSDKQGGIDDAVFAVAMWDVFDPKADQFSIYVRGLSNYSFEVPGPEEGKTTIKHKTLRIDFRRRGDEKNLNEREFELMDPPYEWIYW